MTLALGNQLLVQSSGLTVTITVPITCLGPSVDAVVRLYIFEGSTLPGHGTLLATYSQSVSFAPGQTRNVVFTHAETVTPQTSRDVGVEVVVADKVVASREFDDVYTVGEKGLDWTQMMGLMVVAMVMGMVVPMMEEGE